MKKLFVAPMLRVETTLERLTLCNIISGGVCSDLNI